MYWRCPGLGRMRLWPIAVFLVCWGAGCSSPAPPATKRSTVAVTVARPIAKEVTDYAEFTGRVAAVNTVEVRARVRGYLTKVLFTEGVEVKKGQQLYQIEPDDYQAALTQADAEIERNKQSLVKASADANRARMLYSKDKKAISQEEYDRDIAAEGVAKANLAAAIAARQQAKLNFDYTKVLAPIDGRISRTLVTEGNLVGYNEPTLLTTIVSVDPMYFYFDASEAGVIAYTRLQQQNQADKAQDKKIPCELTLTGNERYDFVGVVDFADNRIDPTTGTLPIRAVFPNPKRMLVPGMFGRVRVPFGQPKPALLISERAIGQDQAVKFVYVLTNDAQGQETVEYRKLELGPRVEGYRAVLNRHNPATQSGLNPDDRVVVSGIMRLRPGVPVVSEEVPMPASTGQTPTKPSPTEPDPSVPVGKSSNTNSKQGN